MIDYSKPYIHPEPPQELREPENDDFYGNFRILVNSGISPQRAGELLGKFNQRSDY